MKLLTTLNSMPFSKVVTVGALMILLSTAAMAQDQSGAAAPTAAAPPIAQDTPLPPMDPQPSAPTPPTPQPKKTPDTRIVGVAPKDIKPTTRFDNDKKMPGQPQAGDPAVVHTLDEALQIAYARDPNVLQAYEHAIKIDATVRGILAVNGPQVSGSVIYQRLANSSSASTTIAGVGFAPSQVQNPFAVGLQAPTPGATPVTLATTTANAAATGTDVSRAADLPGVSRAQNGGAPVVNPVDLDQSSARVVISQFIDITGILRSAQQLGDLEEALSRLELARLRQVTALNVKNAYYNVLRSAAFVRVNQAAVTEGQEQVRVTKAQLTAGVASTFDVLSAQTQLDNNQQALTASEHQLLIAKNALANTLGIDPSTPVDIADIPDVPALPDTDESSNLVKAFKQRPEYYEADTNILVANKNIRLAHRNLEPYLNAAAVGAHSINTPTGAEGRDTAAIGLTLSVPLWDGGATREAIVAAKADERTALIQKDQFVRGIKAEVQQAIVSVKDAYERQTTTSGTVKEAQESLRLANVRFKAGVGTQLEINTAQTALISAESNQVNAQYDYLAAIALLSRSVGNPE